MDAKFSAYGVTQNTQAVIIRIYVFYVSPAKTQDFALSVLNKYTENFKGTQSTMLFTVHCLEWL